MRSTLQSYMTGTDGPRHDRLAAALEKLASKAPAEYPQWADMARQGAQAAGRKDLAGVKQACVQCHDAYRAQFRASIRARRLF
jgi:hypothetical protein